MTGPSESAIRRRLAELEDDVDRADGPTVTINEWVVDENGDRDGLFATLTVGPEGTETERFDPPKPATEVDGEEP